MNKSKISEIEETTNTPKMEPSIIFLILFFTIPLLLLSAAFFYIYYKVFTQWILFILAFLILLFNFGFTIFSLIEEYKKKYPSSLANYDEDDISWFLSSIFTLPFYYLTRSVIIALVFYILFTFGIIELELRKKIFWRTFFTILSFFTFYYSYKNMDIFLYIFSTIILAFMFVTVGEYLGKNPDNRKSIIFPSFMLIISLSTSLFFIHFYQIKILSYIGLFASIFFGFFFIEFSLIPFLENILIFKKEDEQFVSFIVLTLVGIILFLIFIFYRHNIYLYIGASLCLSFGLFSLYLLFQKYYSDEISRDISFSIGFGSLGLFILISYFLFIRESFILLIGISIILFFLRIIYNSVKAIKLENGLNEKKWR